MSFKRILILFACIALLHAEDPDTTYNSDIEDVTRVSQPQYQPPRGKKFKVTQVSNTNQTRYPGGDYIQVEICCELDPSQCITYGALYPLHTGPDSLKFTAGQAKTSEFTSDPRVLECPPHVGADGRILAVGDKFGQGLKVKLSSSSELGQTDSTEELVKYNFIKCFTDEEIIVHILFAKKVGYAYRGVCVPSSTLEKLDVITDLQGCCIDEKDYEITIKVIEDTVCPDPDNPVCQSDVMVITFKQFDSAKVQSIIQDDIVSISMGNTYDFTQLQDKIVICPANLNAEGEGVVQDPVLHPTSDDAESCGLVNAIDYISCTEFKIPCPTNGHKFFFRLVTPGEVYSLGVKQDDGTVKPAEQGLVDCQVIWDEFIAAGEEYAELSIVNDHFQNSVELSRHFKFSIEKKKFKTTIDLECDQPQQLFQYDTVPYCSLMPVLDEKDNGDQGTCYIPATSASASQTWKRQLAGDGEFKGIKVKSRDGSFCPMPCNTQVSKVKQCLTTGAIGILSGILIVALFHFAFKKTKSKPHMSEEPAKQCRPQEQPKVPVLREIIKPEEPEESVSVEEHKVFAAEEQKVIEDEEEQSSEVIDLDDDEDESDSEPIDYDDEDDE